MRFDPDQTVDYSQVIWLTLPTLDIAAIWSILNKETADMVINQLLWQSLGYQFDPASQTWDTSGVATDWVTNYPQPPDFIAGRPASVQLTRSIPATDKQLLKEYLGFKGYKIGEFGPAETRRATAANWLLSHLKQTVGLPSLDAASD